MSTFCDRLREERQRLGHSQSKFAHFGGTTQTSQSSYERGATTPDVNYLIEIANHGVDIRYLITGQRDSEQQLTSEQSNIPHLSESEQRLLEMFRDAPHPVRRFMLAGLEGTKG